MRTATTKVRREEYGRFRRLCEKRGKTPYAVLRILLLAWMNQAQVRDLEEEEQGGGGSRILEEGAIAPQGVQSQSAAAPPADVL